MQYRAKIDGNYTNELINNGLNYEQTACQWDPNNQPDSNYITLSAYDKDLTGLHKIKYMGGVRVYTAHRPIYCMYPLIVQLYFYFIYGTSYIRGYFKLCL